MKKLDGKYVIDTVEDVEELIKVHLPEGLEAHAISDGFYPFIGFNLNRYAYTKLLAAECHAMRDMLNGLVGYSYGFEFKPHVVTHAAKDGEPEWYEVYTG
jgi:phosphoserine phosphatase